MSNIVIYYADVNLGTYGDEKLIRESLLIDKKFVHTKCPVWNHKANRTFVAFSPIDCEITLDKEKEKVENENYLFFDLDHLNSPHPVLQLIFPKFLFWTEHPDVWLNFEDHSMTSLNNNFIAIGGWFNLTNWYRMSSLGMIMLDDRKPISIKKNDPLFRVSFISPNLDCGVILKKITDHEKIKKIINDHETRELNWKSKLFSKTNIKTCPFKFLYDK